MTSKKMKTTHEQYEMIVEYIENHPQLKSNKLANGFTAKDRSQLWEDLTECLNSMRGAQKNVHKWQKTWTDLKHITLKTARIRRKQLENGESFNLESLQEEMSPLQSRILKLYGWNESFGNIKERTFFKESPKSPSSMSEAFYPVIEERSYSENDEPMYEIEEEDDDDDKSVLELFSITKYSDNEYQKEKKASTAISVLLKQQQEILEKISKQHKHILNTELKEKSRRETNKNSVAVLLEQQNKLLGKISQQLERLADARQYRKEESNNCINVLIEQQNLVLEKIAKQQERIADAEHRKADTLPELSNAIKELLKK